MNYYVLCLVCWILLGITGKINSTAPHICSRVPSPRIVNRSFEIPAGKCPRTTLSDNAARAWPVFFLGPIICALASILCCVTHLPPFLVTLVSKFSREVRKKERERKNEKKGGG